MNIFRSDLYERKDKKKKNPQNMLSVLKGDLHIELNQGLAKPRAKLKVIYFYE